MVIFAFGHYIICGSNSKQAPGAVAFIYSKLERQKQ